MATLEDRAADAEFFSNAREAVSAGTENEILDLYAPLSHKHLFRRTTGGHTAPSWVPDVHRRRLSAYWILNGYRNNVSRWSRPRTDEAATERREYGDAELLVSRIVAGVLGDETEIIVDGANDELPDEPNLPERPEPAPDDADDIARRIAELRLARWTDEANRIVDEWDQAWQTQPALRDRQDWLRQWADDEHLAAKLVEGEGDTVGLGDGVYVLTWSTEKRRPRLEVFDPGFYFPVLPDDGSDFPPKVHLAWEYTVGQVTYVRRLTWELVPVAQVVANSIDVDSADFLADYEAAIDADVTLEVLDDGTVARRYPWQDNEEPASPLACVFSDASWRLDKVRNEGVVNLDPDEALYALTEDGQLARDLDLLIDFIPVLHTPNTPATREHFGTSSLMLVAQLLDDLSSNDTDLTDASELAALPLIYLAGGTTQDLLVRAGLIVNGAADGRMDVLDLAQSIPALRELNADRLDRLSVNGQVPAELVGRATDGADAMSGISRLIRLGPFRQLIEHLRLTRTPKRALMLKFVQRMAMVGGALDAGPVPAAQVVHGSYLPSDLSGVVEMVVSLLQAKAISRSTALRMLVGAGLEIDDAQAELGRIEMEDVAGAVMAADATNSDLVAAKRLGIDPGLLPAAAAPIAPTITVPPPDSGGGE